MNDFPYADLILLGGIAVFILLRLRSTLGKKTGFDIRDHMNRMGDTGERIIQLPERTKIRDAAADADALPLAEVKNPELTAGLAGITAVDPGFSAKEFLRGAKAAFEMVFDAFAKGDRASLKALTADDVYQGFDEAIRERESGDSRPETTLVSVTPQEITEAKLDRMTARIAVRFATEQITVTRDKNNVIIEGDPSHVEADEVEWVFERDVRSKDPNWQIVAT